MIINSRDTTKSSSQQSLGSSFLISKPTASTWLGQDLHISYCKVRSSIWKQLETIQEQSAVERSLKTTRSRRYFHSAPSNLLPPAQWFRGSPAPNCSHRTNASSGKSQSIRPGGQEPKAWRKGQEIWEWHPAGLEGDQPKSSLLCQALPHRGLTVGNNLHFLPVWQSPWEPLSPGRPSFPPHLAGVHSRNPFVQ